MKLIKEAVTDIHYITEGVGEAKSHFIEGIFMQAEKKNKNGRVYPMNILESEVGRYNSEYIGKNRAFGELGHPDTPAINLDRVSHMITSLKPVGTNFVGKAKILDTPNGKIVKSLLDGGAALGVSTRGVGSLKPVAGYQQVQNDFRLATAADIVADPSAPDAFVQGIMENYDWWMDTVTGEWRRRQIEAGRKAINEASRADIEEVSLRIFTNFISKF